MHRVAMKMKVVWTWTCKLSLDSHFRFLFHIPSLFHFDSVALLLLFFISVVGWWIVVLEVVVGDRMEFPSMTMDDGG